MGCLKTNCQHANYQRIVAHCKAHHIKLTPLREQVLAIISQSEKPLTAYAILDELKTVKPNAQVMSIYRTLNFLLDNELIHRIESLNAVMLCHHMDACEHLSQWLICERCGEATECDLPIFQQGLNDISEATGFVVTAPVIELTGICPQCQAIENMK